MRLKAMAKINLGLDVLGKREDGYHEVRMIMQTIQDFVIEILKEERKYFFYVSRKLCAVIRIRKQFLIGYVLHGCFRVQIFKKIQIFFDRLLRMSFGRLGAAT